MLKQFLVLTAVAAVATAHAGYFVPELKAIARVASPRGQDVQGNVTFTQQSNGVVHIEGTILGLPHGEYGFHVHEKGDITGGCLSAGAHFNPENKEHGHPSDQIRHVGDLGNVEFDENRIARIDISDSLISLVPGPHGILGRAIVLHERADDFGRTDHPDSRKTGNAGGRVACGVIGILEPVLGAWTSSGFRSTSIIISVFLPIASLLLMLN